MLRFHYRFIKQQVIITNESLREGGGGRHVDLLELERGRLWLPRGEGNGEAEAGEVPDISDQ